MLLHRITDSGVVPMATGGDRSAPPSAVSIRVGPPGQRRQPNPRRRRGDAAEPRGGILPDHRRRGGLRGNGAAKHRRAYIVMKYA